MIKDIAIFGAGGLGREIACLIKTINEKEGKPVWNFIGFFDDKENLKGTRNEYGVILGGINDLNVWKEPLSIVIAIGNPTIVRKVVDKINNSLLDFPNIFAPDTIFLDRDSVSFGKGNIICVGCSFSCNVRIGDFNLFNGFISVGHDAVFGNYNSLMPAVRISGGVEMGIENFIGSAAVILQQIKIGNQTTIGANSTVLRKTKDGNTYVGNPALSVKF